MRNPEARGRRRSVPGAGPRLTRRGLGFSLLSAGLLAAGILRSELGALISGAGLAAAVLASLAGVLLEGRRRDRALGADPEALRPSLSPPSRDGDPDLRALFRIENRGVPLPRAPGISAWVELRCGSRQGRHAEAAAALPAPGSSGAAGFPPSGPLARGVYRGRTAAVAGDAFGFWHSRRELPGILETAALPEPSAAAAAVPRGSGGQRADVSDRRIRGEDRFDSRPYLPGDDPRRLHWKLYARFGDLFVRPGDLSPPPRKTVRILLDTERPAWLAGEAGDYYLDRIVSAALGYARYLEDRGLEVRLSAPGLPDAPPDPPGRLYWLADLAWDAGGAGAVNPGPDPLAVFGAPGAVRRGAVLAERKAAGFDTVLIIPDLPETGPAGFWARFFLVPDGRPAKSGTPGVPRAPGHGPETGRALRAAFRTALDRETRDLSGAGGFDVRVL